MRKAQLADRKILGRYSPCRKTWVGDDLALPSNAIITGVFVETQAHNSNPSSPAYPLEASVRLLKAGVPVGTDHNVGNPLTDYLQAPHTFGRATDAGPGRDGHSG